MHYNVVINFIGSDAVDPSQRAIRRTEKNFEG